jgi:L-fuconolactonase
MRLDSHQHFWKFDPARDAWITDEMSAIRRDFLPEHLLPELQAAQLDGCIAVQADQSETETRFLLDLASQNPLIRGVVGWVDLLAENVGESLQLYAKCKKFRGVRHIVQAEPDNRFMLRRDFQNGIASLKQFGLTYDILIYPQHLPAAIELATRFPDQLFVIDHIAKPPIRSGERLPWARHIREIATCKNVYCKVSGLITEADWKHWKEDDLKPYLDVIFEAFENYRLMFGSDWPVCLLAGTYSRVLEVLERYTSTLPDTQRAAIFGLNAARFYGI